MKHGLDGARIVTGDISSKQHPAHVCHIALSEMMLQSLKYTVRRERPDHSSGYAFPSGHSADTFALATVIAGHPGFGWSLIGYAAASYVAMSRLHDNAMSVRPVADPNGFSYAPLGA